MSIHIKENPQSNYEFASALGNAFKEYRKAIKVSQKKIHELTGISIFTISAFENGKGQGLSLVHFLALLDAVEIRDNLNNLFPEEFPYDLEKIWNKQNRKKRSSTTHD